MAEFDGNASSPSISLIVATLAGWQKYAPVFVTQRAALDVVDGEIIVVDGSGQAPPAQQDIGPSTMWIAAPGEGVFQLRRRAYRLSRAPIVGLSEDHVTFERDWGRIVLALHKEFPDAAVIGGVVDNGTPYGPDEWAVFFIGHFRDMPGVGLARRVSMAGLTNVTYKRRALDDLDLEASTGVNEATHQRMLAARGEVLLIDDRLRVSHFQSKGLAGMMEISWHSARAQAGMRREKMTPQAVVRWIAAPVSPVVYLAMIGAAVARRRYEPRAFLRCLPVMTGILGLRAIGEIVGYAAGMGESASRFP